MAKLIKAQIKTQIKTKKKSEKPGKSKAAAKKTAKPAIKSVMPSDSKETLKNLSLKKGGDKKSIEAPAKLAAASTEQSDDSIDSNDSNDVGLELGTEMGVEKASGPSAGPATGSDGSASLKNFRHHPDMENFYRFIFENELRFEALEIIDSILAEKASQKKLKASKEKAH